MESPADRNGSGGSGVVVVDEMRMYFLVRKDLKMGVGKVAGQVGHAVQKLIVNGNPEVIKCYNEENLNSDINSIVPSAKIILSIPDLETLTKMEELFISKNLPYVKIIDLGRTQIAPNTPTVIGLGPIRKSESPTELSSLKLL